MRDAIRLLPILSLLVAACAGSPAASGPVGASSPSAVATPAPSPSLVLASAQPSAAVSEAPGTGKVYTGILAMDAIEGGCPYLQSPDGTKLQVLYPEGWDLQKAPLQLVAPDGTVHSKAGDRVSIRGDEAADMVSICQIGPIIQATEVLGR